MEIQMQRQIAGETPALLTQLQRRFAEMRAAGQAGAQQAAPLPSQGKKLVSARSPSMPSRDCGTASKAESRCGAIQEIFLRRAARASVQSCAA